MEDDSIILNILIRRSTFTVSYTHLTMGFLHEGHASLIRKCREQNDIVVVSDFVNPTQFGPTEDLEAYPRDFERDSKLCESLGADLIFCPEPSEMYHDPHAFVSIDTLSETLCGKTRPIDVYKRQI